MEKKKISEQKLQKMRFVSWLEFFRFINFGAGGEIDFKLGGLFSNLYFRQICPACAERMKFKRKIADGTLYTCYNCYKSWIKKDKKFTETKLETK
jgi:hypothetical protein